MYCLRSIDFCGCLKDIDGWVVELNTHITHIKSLVTGRQDHEDQFTSRLPCLGSTSLLPLHREDSHSLLGTVTAPSRMADRLTDEFRNSVNRVVCFMKMVL